MTTKQPAVKRVCGDHLKNGNTVILTDDEGVDRYFTLDGSRDRDGRFCGFSFGGKRGREGSHAWYKRAGDFVYVVDPPKTSEQKLEIVTAALKADANNPVSRQILASIGEA